MANEEILRLRTTVLTDEGLAKIRAFGNEFAQMPKKVGAPLKDLNTIFGTLGGTIKKSFVDRRNPDAAIYPPPTKAVHPKSSSRKVSAASNGLAAGPANALACRAC